MALSVEVLVSFVLGSCVLLGVAAFASSIFLNESAHFVSREAIRAAFLWVDIFLDSSCFWWFSAMSLHFSVLDAVR